MLPIPCNGTSLAVSHWKLRIVLMVGYRSSRLNLNKPFSGPVSTLLSSSAEFYSYSLSGHLELTSTAKPQAGGSVTGDGKGAEPRHLLLAREPVQIIYIYIYIYIYSKTFIII